MADEKNPNKPHVLVLPYPAQGHINPMLQFAKRLISKGIKTTLVTTVLLSNTFHASSSSSSSSNSPSFIDVETISDGFDNPGEKEKVTSEVYLSTFRIIGSKSLSELVRRLDEGGNPVDAIVYDGFIPWVLDVAKVFGKLGCVFFTQSCAVANIYYHVHAGLLRVPLSEGRVCLPGLPELECSETPSFVWDFGLYPAAFDMVVNQFSNIGEVDWVFLNTFYELEKQVVEWMGKLWRVRTIGPTIPSMYLDKRLKDDKDYGLNLFKPSIDDCIAWLNDKPNSSVVYVSFGSLAKLETQQMEELSWGLKETNYFFIWVVRELEQPKLPKNFIEETSKKGLVVSWCQQLEVLAHEAIGCFVTHCGFNSILEALSLGVPTVAMPQWSDQVTNAKFVEDVWGIGVWGKVDEKGIVTRKEIEVCMKEVMEGEKGKDMKRNARKWRDLAKEAIEEGGSSDKNIDEFVTTLVCT